MELFLASYHLVLTHLKFSVLVAEMEAVAEAVTPHPTMFARTSLHPLAVAVLLESFLPYIPKTIFVDVALMVVAADA